MNELNDELLAQVHRLATGQLEGTLTEQDLTALRDLLLSNAEARRAYVEHMQDTASLRWIYSGHCDRRTLSTSLSWLPAWVTAERALALAASLLCAATIGWINFHSANEPTANEVANATPPTTTPANASNVATLTGISAVRWGATVAPTLLSRLAVGRELDFTAGTIELTFDSGAQVKVFGPAKIEISSSMSILCSRGRVTTLVGQSGKGFTIDTPKARIVDLGTQFGVNISEKGDTQVVVFQGMVDLKQPSSPASNEGDAEPIAAKWTRRLQQGDAILVDDTGLAQRLVAVQRGDFFPSASARGYGSRHKSPVILDVRDNIRPDESAKCYQIVHGGFREDALSFVDRSHQWNGLTEDGLPEFLLDADYIMPFNDDKFISDLRVEVDVARPATCYVFLDENMTPPAWLRKSFKDTGVDVGLDGAKTVWHVDHELAEGPGHGVDFVFSVWSREIKRPGTVVFGGVEPPKNRPRSSGFNMYGIAVVAK